MDKQEKIKIDKENEINQIFCSNPNFKFKQIIIDNNNSSGYNDIFEVYKSMKDAEIYLASPNKKEYILDIIIIKNCKLYKSLKGHIYYINIVKYFINRNNNYEYLISVDKSNLIIVWDIKSDYSNIFQIKGQTSRGFISSSLICFINSNNKVNSYIIFSYRSKQYTNVYSLDKKEKIEVIENTNNYNTYYILYWLNKKDNSNYIIELSDGNIYMYNILKKSLFYTLNLGELSCSKNYCGIIFTKNNIDYLIVCTSSGTINIWDLENNNIIHSLSLNKCYDKNKIYLSYILQWSEKYIVVCEYYNKGLKILDIDKLKIITTIRGRHSGSIICAKKFMHPIYGESLLTSGEDNNIILWNIR